jgi:plasmid stabilization system protein ParE
MALERVKAILDDLIGTNAPAAARRWWDVMRDEGDTE